MKGKSFLTELLKVFAAMLVLLVIVEIALRVAYFIRNSTVAYVPLPYVIGHDYGSAPPWVDDLRILEPDQALIWKSRANLQRRYIDVFSPVWREEERSALLRQFLPGLPASLKENPAWEISLNSEGYREVEFPQEKRPSTFRIVTLGDSWTFGANVGQEEAYPQQLQTVLKQEFPEAEFEVLNLGVLGYSSYQGLELLKRRAIDLEPDLVVIAFAMNDFSVDGYRDKDMPTYQTQTNESINLAERIGDVLAESEFYKLLRYWSLLIKWKPKPIGHHLKSIAEAAAKPEEAVDYETLEPWTRVSPWDYKQNVLQMIKLARSHEASVILLYNELSADAGEVAGIGRLGVTSPYRMALQEISRAEGVPLVDSSALIAEERGKTEEELERELDLQPPRVSPAPTDGQIEVIFRVYLGKHPVPKGVYIVGANPKLGDLVPNKVAMYDNGTHGDQRAEDKVWSYSATFSAGTDLFYVYTNSGEEGEWEGLDVPAIRYIQVKSKNNEGRLYRPIESFGQIYMQADSWHTNATGYGLIAEVLLEELKKDDKVRRYLEQITAK